MRALVVYEAANGGSERVAAAVAVGLADFVKVDLVEVTDAVPPPRGSYDIVVIGGPTHRFGMSTARSRRADWARGRTARAERVGVREWLRMTAPISATVVAAFDTRKRGISAAHPASRTVARRLASRTSAVVVTPKSFRTTDSATLLEGQLEEAREWGRSLAIVSGAKPRAAAPTVTRVPAQKQRTEAPLGRHGALTS